ncbi:arsenic resistance N-acetyltransferase ArsN2 [Halocatena marina]|uniref:Arsenic resistance N-acetyltransferase ArsN2 n=1 Tax=Halocatena marina TaxID=2934937 RepID=A0ABD5YM70_9EURY|nr:arsenic resistance N-acetyltransferase ArsN2 [Halocatena marina]
MTDEIDLRAAKRDDIGYLKSLLRENGLPVDDIPDVFDSLSVCTIDGKRVGVGGFEQYGQDALLRSVAIEEAERNKGYGKLLCEQLLAVARRKGVSTMYLLTTTADEFFRQLEFKNVDRDTVPRSIQQTREFSDLCPSTATCLKRTL